MAKKVKGLDWAMVQLMRLLEHPNPGFICAPAGDRSNKRFLAHVRHSANEPAPSKELEWLRDTIGMKGKPWLYLYALHDGALLFEPLIPRFKLEPGEDGGFRYFPLAEVRRLAIEGDCIGNHDGHPGETMLPFAEIPMSANLICIKSTRRWLSRQNEIFEANHDCPPGGFGIPKTLPEMFFLMIQEPAFFLRMCGCYTRYSDGVTDTQWIPLRYLPDVSTLSPEQISNEPLPDWWDKF